MLSALSKILPPPEEPLSDQFDADAEEEILRTPAENEVQHDVYMMDVGDAILIDVEASAPSVALDDAIDENLKDLYKGGW